MCWLQLTISCVLLFNFGAAVEIRDDHNHVQCHSDTCMDCQCKMHNSFKRDGHPCKYSCGGHSCSHLNYAHQLCLEWRNRVNGGWSQWKNASTCVSTCGSGVMVQLRLCDNPSPKNGGQDCQGNHSRFVNCNSNPCPVNGGWSQWKNASTCVYTCGSGVTMQLRLCDNPSPKNGGQDCQGTHSRFVNCNLNPCPVTGGWSQWKNVSTCSATCGTAIILQSRLCNNPTPMNGGRYCQGNHTRFIACHSGACPISGGWSLWKNVSACSGTCGKGSILQSRLCNNPTPTNGGINCRGDHSRFVECNANPCSSSSTSIYNSTLRTPTVVTTSTGVVHRCNKMETIHALGVNLYVKHALATKCSSINTSDLPEAVVYKYCSTAHHSLWTKGHNVMDACLNGQTPGSYIAIATFTGDSYNPKADIAGIFLGCSNNGFKMATQRCGHPFQVESVSNSTGMNHVPDPTNYYILV